MPSGVRVWNASGQVVFDSTNATGGVVYGAYEIPPNQQVVIHATEHPGRNARVISWFATYTVNTSGGYPVVTITAPNYTKAVLCVVFIY